MNKKKMMIKASQTQETRPLVAMASCRINCEAAVAGEEKLPTVEIDAYNGGKMTVEWYGDVVIDLKGLATKSKNPILYRHNDWDINNVMGQTNAVQKTESAITIQGKIMSESETTQKVLKLAKNGFEFQASVGILPNQFQKIHADETVEVNGKTLKGPFTLITQGMLREISIVPLGADGSTSAKIAAEVKPQNKRSIMNLWKRKKPAVTATQEPSGEQQTEKVLAELKNLLAQDEMKQEDIDKAKRLMAEIISDDDDEPNTTTPSSDPAAPVQVNAVLEKLQAEIEKVKGKLDAMKIKSSRVEPPNINTGVTPEVTQSVLCAAVAMTAGLQVPEKAYGADACNAAADLKVRSMTDLVRVGLAATGRVLDATRHQTDAFLQAAFSTRDVSNVLADVANKFVLQGYGTVEQSWRKVAFVRNVVDFKTHHGVRLVVGDLLKELTPSGEIQHGSISDEKRSIRADTKALMLAITRADIINDDLGVLSDLPVRLGFASARTFNKDFWAVLVAASDQFSGANGNKVTSADMSLKGLTAAETLFGKMKDTDGNPLGLEATTILTPPEYYAAARQLYASTNITGGGRSMPDGNIFSGKYEPVKSAYLSSGAWYLVANPIAIPLMEVAFLNGNDKPTIESADANFNVLGIQMRCFYDYGVAFGDNKAGVLATV